MLRDIPTYLIFPVLSARNMGCHRKSIWINTGNIVLKTERMLKSSWSLSTKVCCTHFFSKRIKKRREKLYYNILLFGMLTQLLFLMVWSFFPSHRYWNFMKQLVKIVTESRQVLVDLLGRKVEWDVFGNSTLLYHLLQRLADRSVVQVGKHESVFLKPLIMLDDLQGNI